MSSLGKQGVRQRQVEMVGVMSNRDVEACFKGVKSRVVVVVAAGVGWCDGRCFVSGDGIADGITFMIDDGSDMDFSDVSFVGSNDGKLVGSFIFELLE